MLDPVNNFIYCKKKMIGMMMMMMIKNLNYKQNVLFKLQIVLVKQPQWEPAIWLLCYMSVHMILLQHSFALKR